jgi:hypothetical protein
MSTELKQQNNELLNAANMPSMQEIFSKKDSFEHAQRVAKMLASSSLVPARFQDNVQNTMIALEMANRLGASPLMVMQNLYVVHGAPGWSGQFVIAAINGCKRFHELDFETVEDNGRVVRCRAIADDRKTCKTRKGAWVTWEMVVNEGWLDKKGSKWQTMPEQMFMYRAASFFGRVHCPDVLMGMYTVDEIEEYTVMSNMSMDEYLMSLIKTSTYDEDTRDIIRSKVESGLTQQEANSLKDDLKEHQLDPVKQGANYNASDAKNALNNAIKND